MNSSANRLLIVDEEIIPGGLETLRVALLPALSKLCDHVVWALPDHTLDGWKRRLPPIGNIELTGMLPSPGTTQRAAWGLYRRLGPMLPKPLASAWSAALRNKRFRSLARSQGLGHFLTTCALTQEVPKTGLPISAIVCDVSPSLPSATRANIGRWVARADHVACISTFTRDELCSLQPEHRQKMQILPLAGFQVEPQARGAGSPDPTCFYYPAVANPRKDHLTLFQACLRLARRGLHFRCVLSGAGTDSFPKAEPMQWPANEPARRFFADHASELRGRLECRGHLDAKDQAKLFAEAGCIVLSTQYEGFGLPLAEALSWGRPVICTPLHPFMEQAECYRARDRMETFPTGDAAALAERMAIQLKTPQPVETPLETARRMAIWTWTDVALSLWEAVAEAGLAHQRIINHGCVA